MRLFGVVDGLLGREDYGFCGLYPIPFDLPIRRELTTETLDMSFSLVSICNMALGKCGITKQINSLEFSGDDRVSNEARLCALYFELAFRAAARGHDWKCLTKQADISGNITTAPAAGYSYAYALPSDYVGSLKLLDTSVEWRKVGRTLQTDATTILIEYVHFTQNTDLYDDLFTEALVMRLAAHLAPALCGENATAIGKMLIDWHDKVVLPQAKDADARESSTVVIDSSTWRNARRW